jgi:hypothetical protein
MTCDRLTTFLRIYGSSRPFRLSGATRLVEPDGRASVARKKIANQSQQAKMKNSRKHLPDMDLNGFSFLRARRMKVNSRGLARTRQVRPRRSRIGRRLRGKSFGMTRPTQLI